MNQAKQLNFMIDFGTGGRFTLTLGFRLVLVSLLLLTAIVVGGCETEDCVSCVELPAPVVPTGVHSVSQDNEIWVQWYDISYYPYDGNYNPNVRSYAVYSRFYQDDDEFNPDREFFYIGEVAWNENYFEGSGIHRFVDVEAVNGERYEYAVAAVNANGQESALSYELVTDAPLPHSHVSVVLQDKNGAFSQFSGFDFSLLDAGADPSAQGFNADIEVQFQGGVPFVHSVRAAVDLQDFGVFSDGNGDLIFEGVSWAPDNGYSSTNILELIAGHIYVVRISEFPLGTHFAKFGVVETRNSSVEIIWAYQTIQGLPELSISSDNETPTHNPDIISL